MIAITKYIQKNVINALKALKYVVLPKLQLKQENTHLEV